MPSLLHAGVAAPILHVSQLASMLGLEAPAQLEATRLAWDAAALLDAWIAAIGRLDFQTLVLPTPSRGRSLRNLTVNVFHPFELLPAAFDEGRFPWEPERDGEREAPLSDARAIVDYASVRSLAWHDWLLEREPDLLARNPDVHSPRGALTFANLLESQRFHAAFHYRQLVAVLESRGQIAGRPLALSTLGNLDLPPEVF